MLTKTTLLFPSTVTQGRQNTMKSLGVEIMTGERSLSKNHHRENSQLREINLISCQSKEITIMRNKPLILKTLFPTSLFSLGSTLLPNSLPLLHQWGRGMGLWTMHHTLSLLLLSPQTENSPPAPAWGLSFAMQFFKKNSCSVGPSQNCKSWQ